MAAIKDVKGRKLYLTKSALVEAQGSAERSRPWEALFSDIRKAVRFSQRHVTCYEVKSRFAADLIFRVEDYTIGCRQFSKETFKKILKAAEVR